MKTGRKVLLAAMVVVCLCPLASAMDVALKVQETGGVARAADPVRSGIPLAPGAVTDEKKLRLLDDKGAEVDAQFRVINRRPASQGQPVSGGQPVGDIEWVCVDFLADVPANGTAVYHLTDGGPAKAVDKPVRVEDSPNDITVDSGPLMVEVSKKTFAGLGRVWLDRTGNAKAFTDDMLVSKGGALVIKGVDGKVYTSVANLTAPLSVRLEEAGPLHAVVRIDGEMKCQTADGKENTYPTYDWEKGPKVYKVAGIRNPNRDGSLGFTVRLHVWKGQTWVRAFVTMRNLDGTAAEWTETPIQFGRYFADASGRRGNYLVDAVNFEVDLDPAGNLKYRIGGGNEGTEVHAGDLASSKGSVVLHQDSSAGWLWQAGTGRIYDERLKKNAEMLKAQARKQAATRGEDPEAAAAQTPAFTEYNPLVFGELLTRRDGCSFMGYRVYTGAAELAPSSTSGYADLGKETAEGMRAPGWIEADDGTVAVTAGCRWFWQMFPKSLELRAPGKLSVGLWSQCWPRGHLFEGKIHKTHELVFDFRPSGKGLDGASRFGAFTQRLLATPDAKHNLASRAYGDFMLPNKQEWPKFEMSALSAVAFGADPGVALPEKASCTEIEREKYDCYDTWKFGDSIKGNWHYFGQCLELDVPYCMMIHYARTGDVRFYREAEIATRELLDIPAHGGGYGHQCGEPSHYYAYGPMLFANCTADPFLRDAVHYAQDEFIHRGGLGVWHLRSCAVALWSNWIMDWNYPGEKQWRTEMDKAVKYAANIKPTLFGAEKREFFVGMVSDAVGRYCETNPQDKAAREMLVAACREWIKEYKVNTTGGYNRFHDRVTLANGFAYATRFSGDPAFLKYAEENIQPDSDFRTWYCTGTTSAKNWSEFGHRLCQVFLHDIDKQRHPEKYKDLP